MHIQTARVWCTSDFATVRGLLFVALFALWLIVLKELNSNSLRKKRPFGTYVLISVAGFFGFITFIALHAGGINLTALTSFGLLSLVSPALFTAVRYFYPFDLRAIEATATWSALEKPHEARFLFLPACIILVGYFFIVLFSIVNPVINQVRFAVQCAVVAFLGFVAPTIVWIFARIMANPYWTVSMRSAVAASIFPGFANALVLIALSLWAFGLVGSGKVISLLGLQVTFSPLVLMSCCGATVLTYLLPFLRGAASGKSTEITLLNARISAVNRIILELRSPNNAPKDKVHTFRQEYEQGVDEFWDSFPVLGIGVAMEDGTIESNIPKEVLVQAKSHDLRYLQWKWFLQFTLKLEEIEHDLATKESTALTMSVDQWAAYWENIRDMLEKDATEINSRKTVLVAIATIVATYVVTKVFDGLWKYLEEAFRY
jgi:hypothetical protein